MVERSLSMREVPGSIPGASKNYFLQVIREIFFVTSILCTTIIFVNQNFFLLEIEI